MVAIMSEKYLHRHTYMYTYMYVFLIRFCSNSIQFCSIFSIFFYIHTYTYTYIHTYIHRVSPSFSRNVSKVQRSYFLCIQHNEYYSRYGIGVDYALYCNVLYFIFLFIVIIVFYCIALHSYCIRIT